MVKKTTIDQDDQEPRFYPSEIESFSIDGVKIHLCKASSFPAGTFELEGEEVADDAHG